MKKIKLGIILLVLSMSIVSCGGTPEEKVEKYLEKILATQEMKDMIGQMEADGMELTVSAEGTSLKYRYEIIENIENLGGVEAVKSEIEKSMSEPTMVEMQQSELAGVKEECPSVTSIIYEYYDNQGNLLTSAELPVE